MTELLLKYGVPIDRSGALHFAAFYGALDTMRLLIEHGADVNELCPPGYLSATWTPLHSAPLEVDSTP